MLLVIIFFRDTLQYWKNCTFGENLGKPTLVPLVIIKISIFN
jgi:hypothetical protein